MESDPKRFLSRLDIINTLKSRHLHIPDMENLTYEELLRIFKTFAVPLEKRRERERYIPTQYWDYVPDDRLASFPFDLSPIQSATEAQKFIEEHQIIPQQTPHILQHAKFLKLSFNTISNQAPKRYSMHGQDMPGGPTPPKRLMTLP